MAVLSNFDIHPDDSMFIRPALYRDGVVLAAGVAQTITVPTHTASGQKANRVLFSSNCDFYAQYDTTAAVPAGAITDGSGPELNPVGRILSDVDTISVISETGGKVMAYFFI